jgi:hypothetical protein
MIIGEAGIYISDETKINFLKLIGRVSKVSETLLYMNTSGYQ